MGRQRMAAICAGVQGPSRGPRLRQKASSCRQERVTDGPSGFNYTHAGRNWGSGGLVLCHGSAGKTSPP